MEERGFSNDQIAAVIVFYAVGELGGKILLALIGDRLPFLRVYLLVASCLPGTVVLGLLTIAKTYVFVALLGLGM